MAVGQKLVPKRQRRIAVLQEAQAQPAPLVIKGKFSLPVVNNRVAVSPLGRCSLAFARVSMWAKQGVRAIVPLLIFVLTKHENYDSLSLEISSAILPIEN